MSEEVTEEKIGEAKDPIIEEKAESTIQEQIKYIVDAEKINGQDGVWNENQYMAGFHNGIVMCLHTLGVHDVKYKDLVGEGVGMPTVKTPERKPDFLVVPNPK